MQHFNLNLYQDDLGWIDSLIFSVRNPWSKLLLINHFMKLLLHMKREYMDQIFKGKSIIFSVITRSLNMVPE